MASKPRLHIPGGLYHVMLRGNGDDNIFFDSEDRFHFYLLLQKGVTRFGHRIHGFCLMNNHVHFAIQVAGESLAKIMQNISFRYTRWRFVMCLAANSSLNLKVIAVDDLSFTTAMVVYQSLERRACEEHAVVLLAMGIDSEVIPLEDEGFGLRVDARDLARAEEQLALYAGENRALHPCAEFDRPMSTGFLGASLYVVILLLVDLLQRTNAFSLNWWGLGRTQAGLIMHGEWWRGVTALSLHADLFHLAGNLVFGVLFSVLVSQLLGTGLAWSSILVAGTMGNLINAFLQSPTHSSVGASTGVFAALGILSAYQWIRRHQLDERPIRRWAPLIAGLMLLSYLGVGDERTDVGAHLIGFVCGGLLGVLFGLAGKRLELKANYQQILGASAVGLLAIAWLLAF